MRCKIGIEKLKVMAVIGIDAKERQEKQELVIDLKVETNISKSINTDSLSDTLDYTLLKVICVEIADTSSFNLIECFAAKVLRVLQSKFPLSQIGIKVVKPKAIENALAFVELEYIP